MYPPLFWFAYQIGKFLTILEMSWEAQTWWNMTSASQKDTQTDTKNSDSSTSDYDTDLSNEGKFTTEFNLEKKRIPRRHLTLKQRRFNADSTLNRLCFNVMCLLGMWVAIQQAHKIETTSFQHWHRINAGTTLLRHCVPNDKIFRRALWRHFL